MSAHYCTIVDGVLDQHCELEINLPTQVMIPCPFPFTPSNYSFMAVRQWHITNFTNVRDWCADRAIQLSHVYDNVRVKGSHHICDVVLRYPGSTDPAIIVELATLDDAMLFKLSWIN
jgi:hypothetical protein